MNTTKSEHEWFIEQIGAYLANGLDAVERARLESHRQTCATCADELSRVQTMDAQMSELFAATIPPNDFGDRVVSRLRLNARYRRHRIRAVVRRVAIAAAAAIVVGGFGFVGRQYLETGRLPTLEALVAGRGGGGIASNLKQIGQPALLYANENKASYPSSRRGNTNSHDEDADNVMFATGRAKFVNSAFTGVQRDNIYARRGEHAASEVRGSYDANGGVLLPLDGAEHFKPAELASAAAGKWDDKGVAVTAPATGRPPPDTSGRAQAGSLVINDRKVIREGTIEFEVESFDSAFTQISKITTEEGGFVAAADSDKLPNGKVRGSVTVRVPPDRLDTLLLKLRALGDLKSQRLGSRDVSKEYTDLESELRAARAMEERLLEMIKNAKGKVAELLEAEKELGNWRGKIEKLQGQINYYNNLVSMATLTIEAYEKDIKTPAAATQTEEISTGVETDNVEDTRSQIIKTIEEAKGRIIASELKQHEAGQLAATVVAEVPPENSGPIIDRLRQLGKVARLDIQRKQTSTEADGAAPVRVEQAPTKLVIAMYNLANVAPRLTTNVNLAGDDVEALYRGILLRVIESGGRVIASSLRRQDSTQANGTIQFEMKSSQADALLANVRAAGQVLRLEVSENPDTPNVTAAKQAFVVQIMPAAQVAPRETRTLWVQTSEVESAAQTLSGGGRVLESNFSQDASGRTTARLVIEVPLDKADSLVDTARKLGKVRTAESSKNMQSPEGPLAKARLNLTISSGDAIIPGERGFWTSIHEGLSTSVKGLLWSLQLLVIGLCLVGPWVLVIWGGWKLLRRGKPAPAVL